MHDLINRLLQTDPNRRPAIEQVLQHPAISSKVKEFQMLYPDSAHLRPKARFGQPQKAPLLPVNPKRPSVIKESGQAVTKIKTKVNMRPVTKPAQSGASKFRHDIIVRKHSSSTSEIQEQQKHAVNSRVNNPVSLGNLNQVGVAKHDRSNLGKNEKHNVSLGEIERLKMVAKGGGLQATPRPNLPVVTESGGGERERAKREALQKKCFAKKDNRGANVDVLEENRGREVDINQSINSRKEKIDQLLSRYGKAKEGTYFTKL